MKPKAKEDYQALLVAPIDWNAASLSRPDDWIAYLGVQAQDITKLKLGARFRCYYAANGTTRKTYKLVLFEVCAYYDQITKKSSRGYCALATLEFEQDIWGQQIYQEQKP